jgi:hypothetical protein
MPKPPAPVDANHRIDPAHNGDIHAVKDPTTRNGKPITEKPLQNDHGRTIPPGRDNIAKIDRADIHKDIHKIQDKWNTKDHDYHWKNWDGMNVCHHYDEFGFHWWGFYVGNAYFWTRYFNDGYWWFDPYWHRWVFLRDGRWWWQNPDGGIYLYDGSDYYQYDSGDDGVVVTPDPTQPVDVPPGGDEPAAAATYSLDGTRSVQITGENRDAYLYDLTVADPQSAAAQGRFIGTQVAGVKFDYVTADGAAAQSVSQIELSYDGGGAASVVDLNGERRVDVSGDTQSASLVNLADSTVNPVSLADGVTATTLTYGTDDAGAQSLQSIVLTVTDGAGNPSTLTFDRDGASLNASAQRGRFVMPTAAAEQSKLQTLQQKLEGSDTFRALKAGFNW